jgi:hypothetical protein
MVPNGDWEARVEGLWHGHVSNFEELGFKVSPSFLGIHVCFQVSSKMEDFVRLKTFVSYRSWERTIITQKRGATFETEPLKAKHMSRPKFSYLGLSNPISKPTFLSMCGLPFRATSHTRLRTHDHCLRAFSSNLVGGKSRASPSSLHTAREGQMEYVNARWDVTST